MKRQQSKNTNATRKIITDDEIKEQVKLILDKYIGTQVFDSISKIDSDDQFEILMKQSNKILIRYNKLYDYLEILTFHKSLHDWIWANCVINDPDISDGYIIK